MDLFVKVNGANLPQKKYNLVKMNNYSTRFFSVKDSSYIYLT